MMAIPVVMALGAGWATGTMAGAAIGWMIGSWIYSSQTKDKNNTADPAIAQAPKFNSAIRGMVIPVLFGTNRVAAQIPWQNNFQAIRSDGKSGGGGKFGGSGMGGKGSSTSAAASYTYKMDAIYHLGMPDMPVNLLAAWIGSDRVDPQSLLNITYAPINPNNGDASSGVPTSVDFTGTISSLLSTAAQSLRSDTTSPNTVSLTYDGAIFFPGNSPDEAATWPYFTSVIGQPVRFPSTCWVGFQGLNLGSTPSMPQISWEIGPGAEGFDFQSAFISKSVDANGPYLNYGHQALDNSGTHVVFNSSSIVGYNRDSTIAWTWSIADFATALETNRGLVGWLGAGNLGLGFNAVGSFFNGKYIIINVNGQSADIGFVNATVVCGPRAGLVPTILGAVRYERDATGIPYLACFQFDICNAQTESDPMFVRGSLDIAGADMGIAFIPSVSDIITGVYNSPRVVNGTTFVQDEIVYASYILPGLNYDNPEAFYSTNTSSKGFALPSFGLLATPNTCLHFYLGRGIMENADTYTAANIKPDNPLGAMIRFNIGEIFFASFHPPVGSKMVQSFIDISTLEIVNESFIEVTGGSDTGITTLPWKEEFQSQDGTPNTRNQYGLSPYVYRFDNGAYLVVFTQLNQFDDSVTSDGLYPLQIRAFVYNPLKSIFQQIAHQAGFLFSIADWGSSTKGLGVSNATVDVDVNQDTQVLTIWGDNGFTGLDSGMGNGHHWVAQAGTLTLTGGADVYPPYIIKQILTNAIYSPFGSLITVDTLDLDSYNFAVDYCAAQDIKVSTQYRNEENVLTTIELLLALYGGYLTISGGKIKFGVIEATAQPIRVIDNSHLLVDSVGDPPVTSTRGAKQDTFNLIRVNYIDRTLDYNQEQIEEGDEVDQDLYGIRLKEFPPQFVMTETLARTLALRTLWSNLFVRDSHSFKLGWKDADLEPGDVITLVDSISVPPLNQNVRIVKWQEEKRGRFTVQAVQELGYAMTAVGSLFNQSSMSIISNLGPQPKTKFATIYELPGTMGADPTVFVGWVPDAFAAGATLYASADDTTYAPVARASPYPIGGTLLSTLGSNPDEIWAPNISIALFPSSSYTVNTPTFDINQTLNDVGYVDMHYGAGLLWVGSEMIAYTGVNLVGQNVYQLSKVFRGWGGTKIQNHNSGDFFIQQGGGIFSQTYTEDRIGTKLWFKVAPFGQNGVEYPVSSIAATAYTIQGAWFKPQNPSAIQFQGNRGITKLSVGSTIDIGIAWQDTARRAGYGMGGYGTGPQGFGAFITDTLSHSWRLEVVGSSGLVVRSTVVTTTAFTYTSSQNASDNGAWSGRVAFKVTPFSPYGDSPRTSVISMSLF
jgi:hypothetical protein